MGIDCAINEEGIDDLAKNDRKIRRKTREKSLLFIPERGDHQGDAQVIASAFPVYRQR